MRNTLILPLFLCLPASVMAQTWSAVDCRIVLDALQTQALTAARLRQNVDTLGTALRGSDYALYAEKVAPQLVEEPEAEHRRALEMLNLLMKDRCPAN